MAVGKVGSFATVQPAIVDFGGMAQGAFDKMKADEERKRKEDEALKEKRRQEIEKIGGIGGLKSTNIKGINQGLEQIYGDMRKEYAQAKISGDTSKMRELQEEVFSMNNIVDNVVKQHDFYLKNQDKYDADFFNRATSILENIDIANMDVKRGDDGRVRFTVYGNPERTQVLFENMSPTEIVDSLKIPYKFDEERVVKEFTKNYAADTIESILPDKISTVKVEDIANDNRVKSAIASKAEVLSNDSKSLAWYGVKFLDKYESDKNGFTSEEKEKARSYFEKKLTEAYKKEVDYSLQQRRSGGGTRKSDAPTIGSVQRLPQVGNLRDVLFAPIIASGSSRAGVEYANGLKIIGLTYDPKTNQMYPTVPSAVGSSSTIGSRTSGGQGNVGASTSSKDIQGDNITNLTTRFSALARIAEDGGYRDWTEMQQKLFGSLPSEATQQQSTQTNTKADPLGILGN